VDYLFTKDQAFTALRIGRKTCVPKSADDTALGTLGDKALQC